MSDIPIKRSKSTDSSSQDENISEDGKSLNNKECNKIIPATTGETLLIQTSI